MTGIIYSLMDVLIANLNINLNVPKIVLSVIMYHIACNAM